MDELCRAEGVTVAVEPCLCFVPELVGAGGWARGWAGEEDPQQLYVSAVGHEEDFRSVYLLHPPTKV